MSDYTGMYRASVQDIADPEDRGRLRLLIPAVLGDAISGWAEPDMPTKKRPRWDVGDRVWALFEDGDLNRPVYRARQAIHPEDLADDFVLKTMKYCGTDHHTISDKNAFFGYFYMYLSHSDIVEDEALEVYVNGVALGPTWWSLDSENGIVSVTLPDWVEGGEYVRFGYWWRSEATSSAPATVPIQPLFVSASKVDASYTAPTTSVAMPAGIQPGMRVAQGTIIGYVGTTGRTTGPHVHFEVLMNGRPTNPILHATARRAHLVVGV